MIRRPSKIRVSYRHRVTLDELFGSDLGWITDDAACAHHDRPDLWFPEQGGTGEAAKEVCHDCPLEQACLDYALSKGRELDGVWGGTSLHDRRKRWRRAA